MSHLLKTKTGLEHNAYLWLLSTSKSTLNLQCFQHLYFSFRDSKGETVYAEAAADLANPERNTLFVQFPDIHSHSTSLASSLELNFYKYFSFFAIFLNL